MLNAEALLAFSIPACACTPWTMKRSRRNSFCSESSENTPIEECVTKACLTSRRSVGNNNNKRQVLCRSLIVYFLDRKKCNFEYQGRLLHRRVKRQKKPSSAVCFPIPILKVVSKNQTVAPINCRNRSFRGNKKNRIHLSPSSVRASLLGLVLLCYFVIVPVASQNVHGTCFHTLSEFDSDGNNFLTEPEYVAALNVLTNSALGLNSFADLTPELGNSYVSKYVDAKGVNITGVKSESTNVPAEQIAALDSFCQEMLSGSMKALNVQSPIQQQCFLAMSIGDTNRDSFLSNTSTEFTRFANQLSGNNAYGTNTAFESLPESLQRVYTDLRNSDNVVNVAGSKPNEELTTQRQEFLNHICERVALAIAVGTEPDRVVSGGGGSGQGDDTTDSGTGNNNTSNSDAVPVEFTFPECILAMTVSDYDRNNFMDSAEYIRFVDRLGNNAWSSAKVLETLPEALQTNFAALSGGSGMVTVAGSKPGQTPTAEQARNLNKICDETALAMEKALGDLSPNMLEQSPAPGPGPEEGAPTPGPGPGPEEGAPTPGPGPGPGPEEDDIDFATCKQAMVIADSSREDTLGKGEFVVFLSRIDSAIPRTADFSDLQQEYQGIFSNFAGSGNIDVIGSKPGQTPTASQTANLRSICLATAQAIRDVHDPPLSAESKTDAPRGKIVEATRPSKAPTPSSPSGSGAKTSMIVGIIAALVGGGLLVASFMYYRQKKDKGGQFVPQIIRKNGTKETNDVSVMDEYDNYGTKKSQEYQRDAESQEKAPANKEGSLQNPLASMKNMGLGVLFGGKASVKPRQHNEGAFSVEEQDLNEKKREDSNSVDEYDEEKGSGAERAPSGNGKLFGAFVLGKNRKNGGENDLGGDGSVEEFGDTTAYEGDNSTNDLVTYEFDDPTVGSSSKLNKSFSTEPESPSWDNVWVEDDDDHSRSKVPLSEPERPGDKNSRHENDEDDEQSQSFDGEGLIDDRSSNAQPSFASNEEDFSGDAYDGQHEQTGSIGTNRYGAEEEQRRKYLAQVKDLVHTVVPDEIENVEAMMDQFVGREPELINTLQTMHERSTSKRARNAIHRSKAIPQRDSSLISTGGIDGSAAIAAASTIGGKVYYNDNGNQHIGYGDNRGGDSQGSGSYDDGDSGSTYLVQTQFLFFIFISILAHIAYPNFLCFPFAISLIPGFDASYYEGDGYKR